MAAKNAAALKYFTVGIVDHAEELKCYTANKTQTLVPIISAMQRKVIITSILLLLTMAERNGEKGRETRKNLVLAKYDNSLWRLNEWDEAS